MKPKDEAKDAISAIEKHGILLVYPIDNRKEPLSLWSEFYPRTPMRWEWDDDGDDRVARLWHLKTELSGSGRVVYSKWYRGRATFFSHEVFTALLSLLGTGRTAVDGLNREAREILSTLEMDSPLSTKQLKAATDLRGKLNEAAYERALKQLWARLLIVGYGEFDDGAFPSLALGATQLLFEDLWNQARAMSAEEAGEILERKIPADSLFLKKLRSVPPIST